MTHWTRTPGPRPTLPSVEEFFTCAPDCPRCLGSGIVCEEHPDKAWDEGDGCCGAPGIPCRPENRGGDGITPRKANLSLTFCPPPVPVEELCEDCAEGDHQACYEGGGWPYQETNERCACHLQGHHPAA